MSDAESSPAWVTVAEAAEQAEVETGTVRQWYRAGRIPTRRSEGERGSFLVPLHLVLALAQPPEAAPAIASASPSIDETLRALSAETSAEAEAVKQELADARNQLEFLRSQLAEATSENRTLKQQLQLADDQRADLRAQLAGAVDDRKGVESRLLTVESELTQLRRAAARSSITDSSWLELETPAYQSPVRRQAMSPPPDGPTAPFVEVGSVTEAEPRPIELADLLADTRPDGDDDPAADAASPPDDGFDEPDAGTAVRPIWTDETPHPPLGESPDDLLPEPDRKGRFGKK